MAKLSIRDASHSLGVQMYNMKAELIHLPKTLMVASSRPACAAAVTSLLLKLCSAY